MYTIRITVASALPKIIYTILLKTKDINETEILR